MGAINEDIPIGLDKPSGLVHRRGTVTSSDDRLAEIAVNIKDLAKHVHPAVPNPAPLGLIAFGFTTCLLQVKHTDIGGDSKTDGQGVDNVVLGFAMFFGGLLQIVAGICEIKRNNLFGFTAFNLFGGFWLSLGTVIIVSLLATDSPMTINPKAMQAMLFMVGVFTFMLWILSFKLNMTINSLFFLLGTTCILLSFGVENETVDIVGGYFGILTSFNAWWLAFAELVNDIYGEGKREIIPLGHWQCNKFKLAGAVHIPGRIRGHHVATLDENNEQSRDEERGESTSDEESHH